MQLLIRRLTWVFLVLVWNSLIICMAMIYVYNVCVSLCVWVCLSVCLGVCVCVCFYENGIGNGVRIRYCACIVLLFILFSFQLQLPFQLLLHLGRSWVFGCWLLGWRLTAVNCLNARRTPRPCGTPIHCCRCRCCDCDRYCECNCDCDYDCNEQSSHVVRVWQAP